MSGGGGIRINVRNWQAIVSVLIILRFPLHVHSFKMKNGTIKTSGGPLYIKSQKILLLLFLEFITNL